MVENIFLNPKRSPSLCVPEHRNNLCATNYLREQVYDTQRRVQELVWRPQHHAFGQANVTICNSMDKLAWLDSMFGKQDI
jgi:hypothetical protein